MSAVRSSFQWKTRLLILLLYSRSLIAFDASTSLGVVSHGGASLLVDFALCLAGDAFRPRLKGKILVIGELEPAAEHYVRRLSVSSLLKTDASLTLTHSPTSRPSYSKASQMPYHRSKLRIRRACSEL